MKRGYSPEEGSCFVLPLLQEFYSFFGPKYRPGNGGIHHYHADQQ